MDLWFLLTLGGSPGSVAAGSNWLTWTSISLCIVLTAQCWGMSWYFARAAVTSGSRTGQIMKWIFFGLFFFGGFTAFGLRVVMLLVPAWSLFLLCMAGTIAMLTIALVRLYKGRLNVQFVAPQELIEKATALAEHASQVAGYARRESDAAKLRRQAEELRAMLPKPQGP